MPNPTFGSLFAGIGGFDLGFERAGFRCKWQVEIDDYATKILEKHWPKVQRQRDIRECNASNLERVDCVIGGFPCQDISYAGRGAGLAGERSGLFFEAIRLVRELQPRAVVLENVAALLTRGLDRVLGTLAEIGYDAQWHCIPAAAVGAPHIRDRVFVIAVHSNAEANDAGQSYQRNLERCRENCSAKRERLRNQFSGLGSVMANSDSERLSEAGCSEGGCGSSGSGSSVANSRCELRELWPVSGSCSEASPHRNAEATNDKRCGEDVANAESVYAQRLNNGSRQVESWRSSWWDVEPAVGRVANGIPARVDRLRCLGNAIVPQVAEVVANMLKQEMDW